MRRNIDSSSSNKANSKKAIKSVGLVLVGLYIFLLGWLFGGGYKTLVLGIKDRDIQTQNSRLPEDLDYSSVEQVYDQIRAKYDGKLEVDKLLDGLKNGLAEATGDPYTEYFNNEQAKEFDEDLNGSFEGIGAELTKEDDVVVVVSPIEGYPAEKAGLMPKDIIAEIDGENALDLTVSEAVKKIRGPAGTTVRLGVIRDGRRLDFEIKRTKIDIPNVKHEILDGNIGYLRITSFGNDAGSLADEAAKEFKQKNVKGVILDLRGNPGGLLTASVDVSSLWLNYGDTVLQEKRGDEVVRTLKADGGNPLKGIPTVVLIDEGSASASEIVAGALKDHDAATLIGVKSFGKGSVQGLEEISSGGVLKVTIARWYTPNGNNIDKQGISPDKEVKLSEKDIKSKNDKQKKAAISYLKNR